MSPLQLPIRKLGSVETSVCSPSCTYCHPDTRSPLGCLCCSGAAYKAPGILLVPVPAVQPLSVLRTERTAGIRPCSSGNILATIPKHHLWGKFTAQSPLHGGCHKHWLCSGSQKHPCGRFQKLNLHTWDMVHVRLQDPGVLPHRATCSHAQNYRERASLVAWHSKKALHALCPLSRGGVTFRPNETALKRSFFSYNTTCLQFLCLLLMQTLIPCQVCHCSASSSPHLPAAPWLDHLSHKQTARLSLGKSICSRVTCGMSGICLGVEGSALSCRLRFQIRESRLCLGPCTHEVPLGPVPVIQGLFLALTHLCFFPLR